jgi:hypothetical protein
MGAYMATLESYSVKPAGLYPVTVRALDNGHLSLILKDIFTKGFWKDLDEKAPVEIRSPEGQVISPPIREFRS